MMNEENEAPSHVTQDGGSENNRDVMNQQPGPGGPGGPGGPTTSNNTNHRLCNKLIWCL